VLKEFQVFLANLTCAASLLQNAVNAQMNQSTIQYDYVSINANCPNFGSEPSHRLSLCRHG
jgi:hypothetical protein